MSGAKSLIVGAAGQVGAALAALLGPQAIASTRTSGAAGTMVVDLAEVARTPSRAYELLSPLELDAVYCAGGATDVERCEGDEQWAMETNCLGPAAIAAACRSIPFVYFSTEYVFDGEAGPYRETDETAALSLYGRSKLEGERRVREAHPNPLIVRTTVVYGPDRQGKNFLYTLQRLLSNGKTMRVAADQISSPTYNPDLARAVVQLVRGAHSGIFNVAGPEILSRFEFAQLAAGILGLDATLLQPAVTAELNQRAPRPLQAGLVIDKLRSALPDCTMRSNAECIADWSRGEPI